MKIFVKVFRALLHQSLLLPKYNLSNPGSCNNIETPPRFASTGQLCTPAAIPSRNGPVKLSIVTSPYWFFNNFIPESLLSAAWPAIVSYTQPDPVQICKTDASEIFSEFWITQQINCLLWFMPELSNRFVTVYTSQSIKRTYDSLDKILQEYLGLQSILAVVKSGAASRSVGEVLRHVASFLIFHFSYLQFSLDCSWFSS